MKPEAIPKTNRHKNKLILCPECGRGLQRAVRAVQNHFYKSHNRNLSDGDAYRIASPQKHKKVPYSEGIRRDYKVVSGGLPSLGKKR
ncbi:MAG: hypothetical protein ACXWUF_01225 [Methylomagnum sp.]